MTERIYYTIYETLNLVNGYTYIGVHKTKDMYDSYLGSGVLIKKAIAKYGQHNFKKRVLCCALSEKYAYEIESEIVNREWCDKADNYNLVIGGVGSARNKGKPRTRWANNGTRNIRICEDKELPFNFVYGKIGQQLLGSIVITNGTTRVRIRAGTVIPDGWQRIVKKLPKEALKPRSRKWINNGISATMIASTAKIPAGWNYGMLKAALPA